MLPILYSYRRCPYAMRARMALKLAEVAVEIREISLREKPAHMLQASPKATVPVLVLPDGSVIEESIEIMLFALKKHPLAGNIHAGVVALILQNDTGFKQALDAYKYPERFPAQSQLVCRQQGEVFLRQLENLLHKNTYLFDTTPTFADYAIFPFVRQFSAVDASWFGGFNQDSADYPKLRTWLKSLVESDLFKSVMEKQPTYIE